jgi:hypothetical protein
VAGQTADLVGEESLAERLDVAVEACVVKDLIQSSCRTVRGGVWQMPRGLPEGLEAGCGQRDPEAID